jgi:Arc/MetJ-type ribon-helix-helix transcriptional regulator
MGRPVNKYTTVSIPVSLRTRLQGLISGSSFKSVSDYVTYVLREVVAMHESEKLAQPFDEKDVEKIKARLKALGYI